jgi:hypothetical protein
MANPVPRVLDRRTLNRTLLERQLLRERSRTGAAEAVRHLVGLQSQVPETPYVGLWTRLAGFGFEELAGLLTGRRVVRIASLRGTVHLLDAEDALWLRPLLQPALERQFESSRWARGVAGVPRAELARVGRELVEERPRTPAELRAELGPRWPEADPAALATALRHLLPLVQLPPRGVWGRGGGALHTTLTHWLGRPSEPYDPAGDPDPAAREAATREAVRRYLAAFGPATAADAQRWSGLTGLRRTMAGMELTTYRDEAGRTLFDLPEAGLADPETPVPPRLTAPFDNLVLSHQDRSRVLDEAHRSRVMTVNGLVSGTVLADGWTAGSWRTDRSGGRGAARVTFTVTPFPEASPPARPIPAADRDALTAEALALLAVTDPDAEHRVVWAQAE